MADQQAYCFAVAHFTIGKVGWSETYNFPDTTVGEQLMTTVQDLMYARLFLLGTNAQIDYVRVSQVNKPRDARLVNFIYPLQRSNFQTLTPSDFAGPCNDPWVGLQFRVEATDVGNVNRWMIRLIGGVPDAQLMSFRIDPQLTIVPEFPFPPHTRNYWQLTTGGMAWRNFWARFLLNCVHVKLIQAGPPPIFRTTPLQRVIFRRIGKRDRGRPFDLFRGRRKKQTL